MAKEKLHNEVELVQTRRRWGKKNGMLMNIRNWFVMHKIWWMQLETTCSIESKKETHNETFDSTRNIDSTISPLKTSKTCQFFFHQKGFSNHVFNISKIWQTIISKQGTQTLWRKMW